MKRLGLFVAAILMSATVSFASNKEKAPFAATTYQLCSYLDLTSVQARQVEDINEYFMEMQESSLHATNKEIKEEKLQKAVYGNLKLMKRVLDADQYRKYVALINVTNNNNRLMSIESVPDLFLAENK
ncbi:MAG TPA: hypothetical protein DDZ04_02975 [Parabacteroides sp.]|nr:hypothetical protein [Parabacteroides sp.]